MPSRGEIARDLFYERDGARLRVWSDAMWPELSLCFRAAGGRVHAGALLLDGAHLTDLSGQPSAIAGMVRDAATAVGVPADSWCARLAALLRLEFHAVASAPERWPGVAPCDDLVGVIGGLCYPALTVAYDAGCAIESEVPRWARRALDHHDAGAVARAAFSAQATRAVTRAVGRWLTDGVGARLSWSSLGLAIAACDVLAPDDIAALLEHRQAREQHVLSVDDVKLLRWSASFLRRPVYKRIAEEVLRGEVVPQLLRASRTMYGARQVMRRPFPSRLDELERAALAASVMDTRSPPAPRPLVAVQPSAPRAADAMAVAVRRHAQPLASPIAGNVRRAQVFSYAPDVAELAGLSMGTLRLELPRHQGELIAWSQVLRNCLDDFGPAISAGRSVVIGVRQDGMLVGALELDGHRRLRQFVGARNRSLPDTVTAPVMRELVRRGVAVAPAS